MKLALGFLAGVAATLFVGRCVAELLGVDYDVEFLDDPESFEFDQPLYFVSFDESADNEPFPLTLGTDGVFRL